MWKIMIPLYKLFERTGFMFSNKVNAPMFAWSIYYGKEPPFISGHSNHKQKHWNGITIDEAIPNKILTELNAISSIEGRASCQGTLTKEQKTNEVPTYFIFRTENQSQGYVSRLVKKLSMFPDIKSGFDIGPEKKFRVGVVGDMSYETNPHAFNEWWNSLPKRIRISL